MRIIEHFIQCFLGIGHKVANLSGHFEEAVGLPSPKANIASVFTICLLDLLNRKPESEPNLTCICCMGGFKRTPHIHRVVDENNYISLCRSIALKATIHANVRIVRATVTFAQHSRFPESFYNKKTISFFSPFFLYWPWASLWLLILRKMGKV